METLLYCHLAFGVTVKPEANCSLHLFLFCFLFRCPWIIFSKLERRSATSPVFLLIFSHSVSVFLESCHLTLRSRLSFYVLIFKYWASFVTQLVKNSPAVWETWVRSLGWEDSLEKGKATHSNILAWRIPWTEGIFSFCSLLY